MTPTAEQAISLYRHVTHDDSELSAEEQAGIVTDVRAVVLAQYMDGAEAVLKRKRWFESDVACSLCAAMLRAAWKAMPSGHKGEVWNR